MKDVVIICLLMVSFKGFSQSENDFVITVKTDAPNTIDKTLFIIPTSGEGYNYNVDCNNDGIDEAVGLTKEYTCDYAELGGAGTYTIRIKDNTGEGTGFPSFLAGRFDYNINKIISLDQWGTGQWKNMAYAFHKAWDMKFQATDVPNFSAVTDMSGMFHGTHFANPDVSEWDVSNVTDMSKMFATAHAANPDVSNWDVSSVTNMSHMFWDTRLADPDVSNWDVSSVVDMSKIFYVAVMANPDVSGWNVSAVTDMSGMFWFAGSANPDVSNWDVSSVTSMRRMFTEAINAKPNVSKWDVSSVIDMRALFSGAAQANPDVSQWDVSSVQDMGYIFRKAISADPDVSNWDVSSATNMEWMFSGAISANPDVSLWRVSSVTNMHAMFSAASIARPDVSKWDVSSVTKMQAMFSSAYAANPDVSDWDVSSVTDMALLFSGAYSAKPDVSDWNVSSVTTMHAIFAGIVSEVDVSNWDVSSVTNMGYMFSSTIGANPDVSNWDVSSVTNMRYMFANTFYSNPDVINWDVSAVTNMEKMFRGAYSAIPMINHWDVSSVNNMSEMLGLVSLPPRLYDKVLKSFSLQSLVEGVVFDAGNSYYCETSASRENIISTHNWEIQDQGLNCGYDVAIELTESNLSVTFGQSYQLTLAVSNPGFKDILGSMVSTDFSDGHNKLNWTCEVISGDVDCPSENGVGNLNETLDLKIGDQLNFTFNFDLLYVDGLSAEANILLSNADEDIYLANNHTSVNYKLSEISKYTSGSWFDPENPGHGLFLEILEGQGNQGDRVNMYWFTYHDSEPVWLTGVGDIIDEKWVAVDLHMTKGADFPPNFIASDVESDPWGEVFLQFQSPQKIKLNWDTSEGLEEFGSGEVGLTQLSTIADSETGCYSGSFYDPSQSGHGFFVHVTENINSLNQLNVSWFAYHQGGLIWLVGSGLLNENNAAELALYVNSGSSFFQPHAQNGWQFNAEDLVQENWGTLQVSFTDKNNMDVSYQPNDISQFESGTLDFTRLTSIKGHLCGE